jgi:hypothetical protein
LNIFVVQKKASLTRNHERVFMVRFVVSTLLFMGSDGP